MKLFLFSYGFCFCLPAIFGFSLVFARLLPLPDYFIIGMIAVPIMLLVRKNRWKITNIALQVNTLFFALAILMLMISAGHFLQSGSEIGLFNSSLRMVFYCFSFLFLASLCFKNPYALNSLVSGFVCGALYTCLMLWVQWYIDPRYLFGVPILHNTSMESFQFSINRNYVGYFLGAGFSMALGVFMFGDNLRYRKLVFVILLFIFGCIVLTMSRSLLLSIVLVFLFTLAINISRETFFRTLLGVCVVAGGATGILASTGVLQQIFFWMSLIRPGDRIELLTDSINVIALNPLWGVGDGNYRMSVEKIGGHITSDPHNAITWVMAEYGLIVGFTFLLVYFFALWRNFTQANKLLLPFGIYLGLRFFHTGLPISSGHFALWFCLTFLITNPLIKKG